MSAVREIGGNNSEGTLLADLGNSSSMRKVHDFIDRVAPTDLDVLLIGEPGTGKEVVARTIHARSRRASRPFIKVEPSRLKPAPERSGFPLGRWPDGSPDLDRRDGATLYFDEITELDDSAQTFLLRLLLERDRRSRKAARDPSPESRILAATSRDLWKEAEAGRFRPDLLLHLQGLQIRIPPLRERLRDIPRLAEHLLRTMRPPRAGGADPIKAEHYGLLMEYPWPGNVRELRDFLGRLLASGENPAVALRALNRRPGRNGSLYAGGLSLAEMARRTSERVEKQVILKALDDAGWNRKLASERLGISYRSLIEKMRKLGLRGS
jgi:DNA-binding NtrC family response regulator